MYLSTRQSARLVCHAHQGFASSIGIGNWLTAGAVPGFWSRKTRIVRKTQHVRDPKLCFSVESAHSEHFAPKIFRGQGSTYPWKTQVLFVRIKHDLPVSHTHTYTHTPSENVVPCVLIQWIDITFWFLFPTQHETETPDFDVNKKSMETTIIASCLSSENELNTDVLLGARKVSKRLFRLKSLRRCSLQLRCFARNKERKIPCDQLWQNFCSVYVFRK